MQRAQHQTRNRHVEESAEHNVGNTEQWLSLIVGGSLALYGLLQRNPKGLVTAALGGVLASRGLTGHCPVYEAFGVSTSDEDRPKIRTSQAVKVEQRTTVSRTPEEVYGYWRNFENLPRFMHHLESVTVINENRSRWVVKAPLGTTVTWDAEIIKDKKNELISWRSLGGSDVDNAGSVQFRRAPEGTEVRVSLQYDPPGGLIGTVMAKIMGDDPENKIAEDLRRLKEVMEAGETAGVGEKNER